MRQSWQVPLQGRQVRFAAGPGLATMTFSTPDTWRKTDAMCAASAARDSTFT